MIFRQLTKKDLKSARLCCAPWASVASEMLINRVYFAPRKKTMEYFEAVSKHPIFSRTVKELVYDDSVFELVYTLPEYFAEAFEKLQSHLIRDQTIDYDIPLADSFEEYCALYNYQTHLFDRKVDLRILISCLRRMPYIHRLSIIGGSYTTHYAGPDAGFMSGTPPAADMQWYFTRGPYHWDNAKTIIPNKIHGYCWMTTEDDERLRARKHADKWETRGRVNLSKAIQCVGLAIKDFRIGSGNIHDTLITLPILSSPLRGGKAFSLPEFPTNLTKLCIDFCYHCFEWPLADKLYLEYPFGIKGYRDIFSKADQLDELTLDFPFCSARRDIENLLGEQYWPRLRLLRICGADTTPWLIPFINKHGTTVKHLELRGLQCYHHHTWGDLCGLWYEIMKEIQTLSGLKSLCLAGHRNYVGEKYAVAKTRNASEREMMEIMTSIQEISGVKAAPQIIRSTLGDVVYLSEDGTLPVWLQKLKPDC